MEKEGSPEAKQAKPKRNRKRLGNVAGVRSPESLHVFILLAAFLVVADPIQVKWAFAAVVCSNYIVGPAARSSLKNLSLRLYNAAIATLFKS